MEDEYYDAAVFENFLMKVWAHHPFDKIAMVLDNARIHHAKRIQAFLKAHRKPARTGFPTIV